MFSVLCHVFFFSSRRRHTRWPRDWSSDVCSSDLGSSSFITNTTCEISQHLEYLPFGETLIEEHLNSHNSPFKFNAKEYDAETGNYYYGARYYDPKWSTFLTPDPALESYPGISPYAYTLNNAIQYVDPTGVDVEASKDPAADKDGGTGKRSRN